MWLRSAVVRRRHLLQHLQTPPKLPSTEDPCCASLTIPAHSRPTTPPSFSPPYHPPSPSVLTVRHVPANRPVPPPLLHSCVQEHQPEQQPPQCAAGGVLLPLPIALLPVLLLPLLPLLILAPAPSPGLRLRPPEGRRAERLQAQAAAQVGPQPGGRLGGDLDGGLQQRGGEGGAGQRGKPQPGGTGPGGQGGARGRVK